MAIRPDASNNPDELPVVLEKLTQASAENLVLTEQVRQLQAENNWFREHYRMATKQRFGASSERTSPELQLLFNEVEEQTNPSVPEPTLEQARRHVVKPKGKRVVDLANLPVEQVRQELPEAQRQCPQCSGHMHEIGSDVSTEVKQIPAKLVVMEYHRVKYACRHCANHDTSTPVLAAAPRAQAFPGSIASASLVAHIISRKYEMGLPLYRLEDYYSGLGLDLKRQNMANWVIKGAKLVTPIQELLHRELVQRDIVHADETTLQVLREDGRQASTKSYMWVYCSGQEGPPVVLYDYRETRAHEHPREFLNGFRGYLHADGYQAYDTMPDVVVVGCLAHARRGFDEALTALPGPDRKKVTPAHQGLEFCNKLFRIERAARNMTSAERFEYRREHSLPLTQEFNKWLKEQAVKVAPKSKLGAAIGYALNQWPKLTNFMLDGRLEIDNNRCERAVKPFVIGRKNWLFSNTPRGATASAILYSVVETAKANDLTPKDYLNHLFERIPCLDPADTQAFTDLLPWAPGMLARCAKRPSDRV